MKNNKIAVFGLIIIVLAVVAVAGFKFYAGNKGNNPPADQGFIINGKINVEGIVLNNLNDSEKKFLETVKDKLRKNPEDIDALLNLARLQKYNGDSEDSLKTLKIAEDIKPDDTLILNNKLDILFNIKKYDEAESVALKIIELNSQWINAYRTLQDIYKYHKTDVYATDKFPNLVKKGIELDYQGMNKVVFTAILAGYYKDIKNKEEALSWYEKYYKLNPDPLVLQELEEVKKW